MNFILQKNKWIEELDLSNNGLDDDGIREISTGLAKNTSIRELNLSSNHFTEVGAMYLSQALKQNSFLRKLDLSRNALGFRSISILRSCCQPRDIQVETFGNYVFEEILNSVTHGIAFLGSVIGANVLISDTMEVYKDDYHFWACAIYSFALMFLFLSSSLFHSFFMLPTSKLREKMAMKVEEESMTSLAPLPCAHENERSDAVPSTNKDACVCSCVFVFFAFTYTPLHSIYLSILFSDAHSPGA